MGRQDDTFKIFGVVTEDQLKSIEANIKAINEMIPKLAHDKLSDSAEGELKKEWAEEDKISAERASSGSSSKGDRTPSKTTTG